MVVWPAEFLNRKLQASH